MKSKSIKTLALFTADPWESAMPAIRVRAPARFAGVEILQGNHSDNIDQTVLERCDGIIIQRDFPRFPGCEDLLKKTQAKNIPIIYECDDMILETPRDHVSHPAFIDVLFKILRTMIQADLVVASTQALAEYFSMINPNTRVFPNYLDDEVWKIQDKSKPPERSEPITIGYMGGASHFRDLEFVMPALLSVMEKYGSRIRLTIWGAEPPRDLKRNDNVVWHEMNLLDYQEFASRFEEIPADIWIAPLQDIPFNQYKSAIKFMEYAAVGGAAIFSRIRAYTEVIQNGRNGLLASNQAEWQAELERLIEDPGLRTKLATGARQTLVSSWLLSDHYKNWLDTYTHGLAATGKGSDPSDMQILQTFLRISEQVEDRVAQLESENQHLKMQSEKYNRITTSRIWRAGKYIQRILHRGEG
jgi:glycosyltransferase involved in cell wall biosynthesis